MSPIEGQGEGGMSLLSDSHNRSRTPTQMAAPIGLQARRILCSAEFILPHYAKARLAGNSE